MALVYSTTVHDEQGHLTEKLRALMPQLQKRFQSIAVLITQTTDESIKNIFTENNAHIDYAEPNMDHAGRHRRRALELALNEPQMTHILRTDLDHLLRWIEQDATELDRILENIQHSDYTVIGRGPKAFSALPDRLREPEKIINHIFALTTGHQWDPSMGACAMSRKAAKIIVQKGTVETVGNDVEWPLLCLQNGLNVKQIEAEGLTYQTEENYAKNAQDTLDQDPTAWAFRMQLAYQQIQAMQPYIDGLKK